MDLPNRDATRCRVGKARNDSWRRPRRSFQKRAPRTMWHGWEFKWVVKRRPGVHGVEQVFSRCHVAESDSPEDGLNYVELPRRTGALSNRVYGKRSESSERHVCITLSKAVCVSTAVDHERQESKMKGRTALPSIWSSEISGAQHRIKIS